MTAERPLRHLQLQHERSELVACCGHLRVEFIRRQVAKQRGHRILHGLHDHGVTRAEELLHKYPRRLRHGHVE